MAGGERVGVREKEGGKKGRLEWGIKGMRGRITLLAGGVSVLSIIAVCLSTLCLSIRLGVNSLQSRPKLFPLLCLCVCDGGGCQCLQLVSSLVSPPSVTVDSLHLLQVFRS